MQLRSHGKIYNLGHKAIEDLLLDPVVIQAKIDGSFGAMGVINGELHVRSKGRAIPLETDDKLFKGFVDTAKDLYDRRLLAEGVTYRGEVVSARRHNTLTYDRVPRGYFILFDIDTGMEDFMLPDELEIEAERLGLEYVPTLYHGKIDSLEQLEKLLDREAYLGGCKEEGIVIKNYWRFGRDGKVLMGKMVREDFREDNKKHWKMKKDIVGQIVERYRNENRYRKAVQHLREEGTLQQAPQDIGPLMKEVAQDVHAECADEIKEMLFSHYWKQISKGITSDIPNWYKAELTKLQFGDG